MALNQKQFMVLKCSIVFIIILFYISRSIIQKHCCQDQDKSTDGISDPTFKLSNEMNIYFRKPQHRNYIIAIISCALDCMMCG